MSYWVTKAGKVLFNCEACQTALESPLDDAGQKFPCPTCGTVFVVPGADELQAKRQHDEEAQRRQAADRAAQQAIAADKEQQRQAAAARRAEEEAQKERRLVQQAMVDAVLPRRPSRAGYVSLGTLALTVLVLYFFVISPMETRLHEAENRLRALGEVVDANAKAMNEIARIAENANRFAHSHGSRF